MHHTKKTNLDCSTSS